MEDKKLFTVLLLTTTIVLLSVGLFTIFKLFKIGGNIPFIGQEEPYPTSPSPSADVSPSPSPVSPANVCELTFTFSISPSPSPSPSPTVPPSSSPSSAPSPQPECWGRCSQNSQCPTSLSCQNISGNNRCVNQSCPTESDCTCYPPASSPSSPRPPASPQPPVSHQPQISPVPLPEAGVVSPTLIFSIGGIALLLLGILL